MATMYAVEVMVSMEDAQMYDSPMCEEVYRTPSFEKACERASRECRNGAIQADIIDAYTYKFIKSYTE